MKIILRKTFGEIHIESTDDKDAIAQASFWGELPDQCPTCNAGLYLHYRITKEGDYKYYELYCRGRVKHYTQFGQYKTGGLFYKADSWAEHTFNSVQSECGAEIAQYDQPDDERGELVTAIKRGVAAIKDLGGKVEAANFNGMSVDDLRDDLTAIRDQYTRLKANKK